ncbi:MAG: hypothetical protein ACRYGR_01475 [Janthinobacterium lividum]
MKKALLLWTLFTPLVMASEIKEDLISSISPSVKIAGERIEDWKLSGDFNRTYDDNGFGENRYFNIKPIFKNSIIKKISLLGYHGDTYGILLNTKKEIDISLEFQQKFSISTLKFFFEVKKIEDFPEFLSFFYENQYIPDCIIDVIFEKMADRKVFIEDFRLTPAKLALDLNQFLTKQRCEEDVQTFLTQKLDTVKNPARRQDLVAEVIVNLQEKNPSASSLIKTLAQEVIDPAATPLYAKVKSIQSDIEMNDMVTEKDSQKPYERALQTLLDIPSTSIEPKVQNQIDTQIHTLVKNIYNNNKPSSYPLPLPLQNLKLNSDSMLKMLMYITQLTQENQKLQQEMKKEVAPDGSN